MFFLYLALWIVFNGKFTLEILIIGIIIATALTAFMCKFGDYSMKKDMRILKRIKYLIKYAFTLVKEIIKANVAVFRLILSGTEEPDPVLVEFESDLKKDASKALLANAITLTPGTITVALEENKFIVHSLDEPYVEGINQSEFVEILSEIDN